MESTAQQRRSLILEELARSRTVRIAELSERFGVSEVLIRRDLERLHQQGLLKRVHGARWSCRERPPMLRRRLTASPISKKRNVSGPRRPGSSVRATG